MCVKMWVSAYTHSIGGEGLIVNKYQWENMREGNNCTRQSEFESI